MEHEQESLESFLAWAAQLGISDSTIINQPQHSLSSLAHSLCVSLFPHSGGRGLGAVRDLTRGEIILRVPKSALMTRESVMEDKNVCLAVNRHSSLSPVQILTVCLLYEVGKGKTSRWHPYLMHLPRSYDVLATFGEFEKHALQVDESMWVTEKAVLKAKSEWKEAHALMEDIIFKPKLLTFNAWVWAAATISSRTLHIPWDEAGCLCPVGDLFNYYAPGVEPSGTEDEESFLSNSSIHVSALSNGDKNIMVDAEKIDSHSQRLTDGGFDGDANAYCFYARTHYKKGDQENPNDKIFIPLKPAVYSSTSWSKESLYIHHNGKPSFALLAALRLWATPQNKRRSVGHLAYSGSQLSADNEIFIMKWLLKTCDAVSKNLPTSIEDDNMLLNAMDSGQDFFIFMGFIKLMSSRDEVYTFLEAHGMKDAHSFAHKLLSKNVRRSMDRWKLAVQWRRLYKKVLVDCISYCDEILNSFMK